MAPLANPFALLEGEEGDIELELTQMVAPKVQVEKKKKKDKKNQSSNISSLPAQNGRKEIGKGNGSGSQGRPSGREYGSYVQQFQNGNYVPQFKNGNGIKTVQNGNGTKQIQNGNGIKQVQNGNGTKQLQNIHPVDNERKDGWINVQNNRRSSYRNGNVSDGGDRNFNGRDSQSVYSEGGSICSRNGTSRAELSESGETKVDLAEISCHVPDGNVPVITNASKDVVGSKTPSGSNSENKIEVMRQEERRKMTLQQYERMLLRKKKSLGVSKTNVRKVTLDKDFESMQVLSRKEEDDISIKMKSPKVTLKKKVSLDKDVKVSKPVRANGLLDLDYGNLRAKFIRRPKVWDEKKDVPVVPEPATVESAPVVVPVEETKPVVPKIEDPNEFPSLIGN